MDACLICKCWRPPHSELAWGNGEYVLSYHRYSANLHVPFEILDDQMTEKAIRGFWEAVMHAYFCCSGGLRFVREAHEVYLDEILQVVADWIKRRKRASECEMVRITEIKCYSL